MTSNAQSETSPAPAGVIDGRSAATKRRDALAARRIADPREVPGLDFPVPGGGVVRLPYPAVRYQPRPKELAVGQIGAAEVEVITRVGYPWAVEQVVQKFRTMLEIGGEREIFAAAVVVAWALLSHRRSAGLEPIDPARLFEMDGDDALVFVLRITRLVNGLVDLDQDGDGCYLLPVPTSEELSDSESESESK